VLYRAILIGTDLAAATRPLHWKDTGNLTRDLVAAPTSGDSCWSWLPILIACQRQGLTPGGPRPLRLDRRSSRRARFTKARPCDER
jgi:hypothetical protein